ncbi:MAG: hypothetical protein ACTSWN_08140, partial [Promethearchaeota archaeon]
NEGYIDDQPWFLGSPDVLSVDPIPYFMAHCILGVGAILAMVFVIINVYKTRSRKKKNKQQEMIDIWEKVYKINKISACKGTE